MTENHRRFYLDRDTDVTGASGTGRVADGVQWPDGTATVRWRGERPSTVNWDRTEDAKAIHGHGGATRITWIDTPGPPPAEYGDAWRELAGCAGCLNAYREANGIDYFDRYPWPGW